MANIYTDGTYFQKNPTFDSEHSEWKACHIATILARNDIEFETLCEIGCGGGQILCELADKAYPEKKYVGYDISVQAINYCKDNVLRANVDFCYGSVESINDFFDVMLCVDVFEHVEDCFGFLRELKNKSKNFVFHIPLEICAWNSLKKSSFQNVRDSVGHIHHYSRETALATLEDCGYCVIDSIMTRGAMELPYKKTVNARILNSLRRVTEFIGKDNASRLWGGYSLMVLAR